MPEIAAEVKSPITQREVEHALRGMPMKKSPGPDDTTTEMRVAAGDKGIIELTKLSNMYKEASQVNYINRYLSHFRRYMGQLSVNNTTQSE